MQSKPQNQPFTFNKQVWYDFYANDIDKDRIIEAAESRIITAVAQVVTEKIRASNTRLVLEPSRQNVTEAVMHVELSDEILSIRFHRLGPVPFPLSSCRK